MKLFNKRLGKLTGAQLKLENFFLNFTLEFKEKKDF